jgi:hypothetical protein
MRRNRYVWAVFFLLLMPIAASFAGLPAKSVAHYTVNSMGHDIGTVATTQRITEENGQPRLNFETKTAVNASFLWMGYHLNTLEKGTLQGQDLVQYSRKGEENGIPIDVKGQFENGSFRFDVLEQGRERRIVIPRTAYDYTTLECPEARIDFSDKPHISLRVLDVEKLAVVKRDYHLVQNGDYTVSGKKYPCRIVEYSDQNKKAKRWISWDGTSVVMYRQDGKGDKNSYSVQATSVKKEL